MLIQPSGPVLSEIPLSFGPAIPLPGLFGGREVNPIAIVGAWIGLTVGFHLLQHLYHRLRAAVMVHTGWETFDGSADEETVRALEDGPAFTVEELESRLAAEHDRWPQLARWTVRAVGIAPIVEEMVFRGVPVMIALTLTGRETLLPLLLAGHVLWAAGHGRRRPRAARVLGSFTAGVVLVYLWVIGLWWAAIALHALNNATAMVALALLTWWDARGRPFRPGEELTVEISDRLPPRGGLYGGFTPDRRRIYVPGAEPGETATVRVATTVASLGYGIPLDGASPESG